MNEPLSETGLALDKGSNGVWHMEWPALSSTQNADLPGHSVGINNVCTIKLEHFDEIETRGKHNFQNEFLEMVFQFLEEIVIY